MKNKLYICRDLYFARRYLIVEDDCIIIASYASLEEAKENYPNLPMGPDFDLM